MDYLRCTWAEIKHYLIVLLYSLPFGFLFGITNAYHLAGKYSDSPWLFPAFLVPALITTHYFPRRR